MTAYDTRTNRPFGHFHRDVVTVFAEEGTLKTMIEPVTETLCYV